MVRCHVAVEFLALVAEAVVEPTSLLVVAEAVAAGLRGLLPLRVHSDLLLRETLISKALLAQTVSLDLLLWEAVARLTLVRPRDSLRMI
jgi:hypothetical protein